MSEPISFVTWLWSEPGHPRQFAPHYVNVLSAMIARHYSKPHRMIAVVDETYRGALFDSSIEVIDMPKHLRDVRTLHGRRFPSCYRRLWNFSPEARAVLGPRIVSLDIDVVIVGDLTAIVQRRERFVGWTDSRKTWENKIAGGLYMLETGAHTDVWSRFDPRTSPREALRCGVSGSDQAWMSYILYPPEGQWTAADGVLSIKWLQDGAPLPPTARIISTPGEDKPWSKALQKRFPWIKEHWIL